MRSLQVADGTFYCQKLICFALPGRANRAFSSGPLVTRLVSPAMLWRCCLHLTLLQVIQVKSTEGHAHGPAVPSCTGADWGDPTRPASAGSCCPSAGCSAQPARQKLPWETARGSIRGLLVGIPIRRSSDGCREWPTDRERLGYICNPRSLKEGTETSHPVATAAVPPRWAAGSRFGSSSENLNMRCTCCLLILTLWSGATVCNNRMPMYIGSFSLHSKWIGLSKWDPNSSDIRRDVYVPYFRERGLHT